jgi:threonine/homoserine/homoserine lactone efflux protein
MLIEAVYKGILVGLTLFISMGPIFFAVIETSLRKGFRYAICISLGTLASDLMYITLIFFGLSTLLSKHFFHLGLGIGGSIVLVIFGITYFFKKSDMHAANLHIQKPSYHVYIIKGFAINTLNPFVIFFWIATLGLASNLFPDSETDKLIFFGTILATVFSTDMLKAFLAGKIKHIITPKRLHWVNIITGIAMIIFAVHLMSKTLNGH